MNPEPSKNLGPYVFENIVDGVLLLTYDGSVAYANKSAKRMLRLEEKSLPRSFPGELLQPMSEDNDEFCSVILDTLYEKDRVISKKTHFHTVDGKQLTLHIKSSYWNDPDQDQKSGVLIILQDVTREEALRKERDDSIYIFSVLLVSIGVWTLFCSTLEHFHKTIPPYFMTYILIAYGLVLTWVTYRKTSFKVGDMGLSFRNARRPILINLVISAAACLFMIGLKWLLIRTGSGFFQEGAPFWNLQPDLGILLYPLSVLMQEFLSQGAIHECLIRLLEGTRSRYLSVLLSGVLFTVLHVHRGFLFMLGSLFLVCIVGIAYRRQRTIWGISITHYTIAMMAFLLNYV